MFNIFKRRKSLPVAEPAPPEPPKPKPYILNPFTKGIQEGVYFVVYLNDFCSPGMCFSTSMELAVYGQELDYTLVVPVDRKTVRGEREYVPKSRGIIIRDSPLSEITPKSIAEVFLKEQELESRRRSPHFPWTMPGDTSYPTLWYETSLEKVVWERSGADNNKEHRVIPSWN